MQLTIAAVIPLYNGAEFIEEAILSVVRQTVPVDEIIVVDDGSTDNGPEIVDRLGGLKKITFLRKPNGGQSSARNLAVRHTKCSHIALLDQDDIWYDDHIDLLRRPFLEGRRQDLGVVYGNLDHINKHGGMISYRYLDEISTKHPKTSLRQCLEHDLFILPSASLISNEAMTSVGLFDERLSGYEDDDLFTRMFSAGYRIIYIDTAVTKLRIYRSSSSFSSTMAKSRLIYFKKLLQLFPDDPDIEISWGRDVIGPRFMLTAYNEFEQATLNRDLPMLERSWSEIREIAPVMRARTRGRIGGITPIIPFLYRNHLTRFARVLVRRAIGRTLLNRTRRRPRTRCPDIGDRSENS
jgi:glycosyltransferase involved in cell wall biosynthesis